MSLDEAKNVLNRKPSQSKLDSLRKIVILKTLWYPEVISGLEKSALDYLYSLGVSKNLIEIQEVPGSFELPLAAQSYFSNSDDKIKPDLVIALGCIVNGETPHFDYICQAVTQGLMRVQLDQNCPVGFGVLTVNKLSEAMARRDKGAEAVQAAFWMYDKFSNKGS